MNLNTLTLVFISLTGAFLIISLLFWTFIRFQRIARKNELSWHRQGFYTLWIISLVFALVTIVLYFAT